MHTFMQAALQKERPNAPYIFIIQVYHKAAPLQSELSIYPLFCCSQQPQVHLDVSRNLNDPLRSLYNREIADVQFSIVLSGLPAPNCCPS